VFVGSLFQSEIIVEKSEFEMACGSSNGILEGFIVANDDEE
jgi:hypothetical protein